MKNSLPDSKNVFATTAFCCKVYLLVFAVLFCFGNSLYAGVKPIRKGHPNIKQRLAMHNLAARRSGGASPAISYASPQVITQGQKVNITPTMAADSAYGFGVPTAVGAACIPNTTTLGILPLGLAIDGAGNFFITQMTEIDEISPNGTLTQIATGFNSLTEIALDGAGTIYVVDNGANEVIKLTGRLRTKTVIATGLSNAFGIAVDPAGNAYVSEYAIGGGSYTGDVKRIQAGTTTATLYGTVPGGVLNGLTLDTQGNLFIADGQNEAVEEIPADGGALITVMTSADLQAPAGYVTVDKGGTLFVQTFNGAGGTSIVYKFPGTNGAIGNFYATNADINEIAIGATGGLYAACVEDQNGVTGIINYTPSGGYFINKNLPQGMYFDGSTGIISGIPLVSSPSTDYTVTAYQNDSTGVITSASAVVNITVNAVTGTQVSYSSPLKYPVNYAIPPVNPINSGGLPGALNYMPTSSAIGSGFNKPNGIAKDAAGNFYIADRGNNEVKKMTAGGSISVIGSGFSKPTGVAVDAAGNVYVADYGNNAVKKIPPGSNTPVLWGTGFKTPLGIAVDAAGNVYVADKGNGEVKKISTTGVTTIIGSSGFTSPTAVAVDGAGNIDVVDSEQGSVERIPAGGGSPQLVTYGLSNPFGIAVDNAGDIFVATVNDEAVYALIGGSYLTTFIGQEFSSPQGIMVDSQGNIYVADTGNNEIRLIQPAGGYFFNKPLPAGMQYNSSTGIISGTPTAITPVSSYIATAWNPLGSSSTSFSVQVTASPLLSNLALSAGSLNPAFTSLTNNYTANVSNSTSSITVTPTTADPNAAVKVNGTAVTSGTASTAINLIVGQNTINIVVTAQDGTTTDSYTVVVTRLSTDAYLAGLTVQTATLSPAFAFNTTTYTSSVPNTTTSVTVSPSAQDATASLITVNGTAVVNNSVSAPIHLAVGANTLTVVVTAQDGVTTQTYTVTITRASSTNANLAALTVSNGTLTPAFGAATTSYTLSVSSTVTSITLTPTTSDPDATIIVNGAAVTSGSPSAPLQLAVGANIINTIVTASDGSTTKTYTITVNRASPADASLAALAVSSGNLSPAFTATTISYTLSVPNAVSSITVTPTTTDADAKVLVNGSAVTSGTPSSSQQLAVGSNTISIIVTASNGTTTKTYTITVTRANPVSSNANLANITLSKGTLSPAFATGTTSYTDMVTNGTTSITLTPALADATASLTVNGTAVVSGHASGAIVLAVGNNIITIVVTAQDGVTKNTYTVNVIRPSTDAKLSAFKISMGTLTPVFNTNTTSYTASVTNTTASITVTPTAAVAGATITVNGVAVASGTASAAIPLSFGSNTITTVVTAQDGVTTDTYTLTLSRIASTNDNLANLTLSKGTLSPAFATATTSYTDMVTNGTASVTLTPTVADATATVTVNGTAVKSGSPSGAIALSVGTNAVSVMVTAQDGVTTQTYTVNVIRPSTNAKLSALSISSGTLTPVFNTNTTSYTASVGASSIAVTPTVTVAGATVKVNGNTVTPGMASGAIALSVGSNTISVVVTAQDGVTTDTYTLTVTRTAASTNDNLSALTISKGTLSPAFATATTTYSVMETNGTTSVTVTPTAADATATITVNGTAVTSGRASGAIALAVGTNAITTVVTAQDGVTEQTYTVNVIRPSTNAKLSALTISSGTLAPAFNTNTTNYSASVTNATTSITLTPTVAVTGATVTVNGTAVASGSPSGPLNLAVGSNTITTVVTAQDGVTTDTYTLTVTRAAAGENNPDAAVSVGVQNVEPLLADDGIMVHQGISPNGDGINDYLQIDNISRYPDNKLAIMNRNGLLVFESRGYDNATKAFDGHSNKTGQMQLPGTYFYELDYTVSGIVKHKTGYLVLKY